jgi:hypothetical protein
VQVHEQTEGRPAGSAAGGGRVVYGVVRADGSLEALPLGIGDSQVRRVTSGTVAALASAVDDGDLRATRRDLLSHSRVLERAFESGPVLPFRFGTVFTDDQAVMSELLEPRHDELAALLARFEHLVELRVKGFYIEESVLREIVNSDREIARLREATRGLPEDAGYGRRVRLGEAVAAAVEARQVRDAQEVVRRLAPDAEDVAVDSESPHGVALVASFLVHRNRIGAFDKTMDVLARQHEGRITFKYLGPLPPYSFVTLSCEGHRWAS